ncbi:MAG: sensor histidine kinase, partial [Anaerolineales bacterium]
MRENGGEIDLRRLLRLAVALWVGYLLALAAIDHLFYPRPVFPPHYYLINGLAALIVWGLLLWRGGQAWLGRAFLPLVIGLMSLVPVITSNLAVLGLRPGPFHQPEALMLRTLPVLFVALVLTAWRYRRRVVVLFSVGVTLLGLGLHLLFYRPGEASLLPPVIVLLIQLISFLVVGYFISVLMTRLQEQRTALEAAHARLVHYAGTLEELTISRERNRMARELHDTLAHTLSALSVQLETARAYWDVDPEAARQVLETSLAATRSGLQETRRALKALRAAPLEDLGLLLALRRQAEESAAQAGATLSLSLPERLPALSPAVEQALYRIAQEALANAVHHAGARALTVELALEGEALSLLVADDGRGFDPQSPAAGGHFGLPGMQERAQRIGGELQVTSRSGGGTAVRCTVQVGRV